MAKRKALLLFHDWKGAFEDMTGDECKQILLDMIEYSEREEIDEPKVENYTGTAKTAARFIFPQITRAKQIAKAGKNGGIASAASKQSKQQSSESQATVKQSSSESQATVKQTSSESQANVNNKTKQNKNKTKQNNLQLQQEAAREEKRIPIFSEIYSYFKNELCADDAQNEAAKFEAYNAKRGWDCLPEWKLNANLWMARATDHSG